MNRVFGITGILAAGFSAFLTWFVLVLPWWSIYGPRDASAFAWMLWGAISVLGVAVVFGFVRYSFTAHWTAFRRNTLMPPAAWRGVCGVYLLVMLALALPVLHGDPYGAHRGEMYLYACLAGLGFVLTVIALRSSFRHIARDTEKT